MAIKPPKKLELEALSQYGMRLLAQRARSVAELRQKLWMRAERESDVDQVMAKLKALRVLDDTQYAEHYAETQARSNRVGRQRVMRDLLQKRVSRTVAQKAVGEAFSEVDEISQIEQFVVRKLRNQNPAEYLADPNHLASMYRRLRTAGFATGPSIKVLRRFSEQAGQLEGMEEPE